MPKTSPHDRPATEARRHRNTYAVLAASFTVLAALAMWGKQQQNSTASGTLAQKSGRVAPAAWRQRIDALRQLAEAPESTGAAASALKTASLSLADALAEVDLEATDAGESAWSARVDRLLERTTQATPPADDAPLSAAAAKRAQAQVDAAVRQIAQDDAEANAEATRAATTQVTEARQPELRAATLAVRDAQDQIEQLETAIDRAVRSGEALKDKSRRAAALARDLAEIRSLLSPFITPGYFQPPAGGGHKYEQTTDAKPVSLSRLRRAGALDPTTAGRMYLLRFGGNRASRGNRRPLGSFPEYRGEPSPENDRNMPRVVRAQQLLREHGQALVEARMLSE